jgi:putative ABC transport system permease protein
MSPFEIQNFFLSPLTSGLIFALLVLGVFIAYRVLDVADLSVEGIFPLVTVLSCFLILRNVNPFVVALIALLIGVAAGIVNACLSIYLKIPPLLAGIIVMAALFAVSVVIVQLNKGSVNLPSDSFTVFSWFSNLLLSAGMTKTWVSFVSPIIIVGTFLTLAVLLVYFFFGTELGLAIRASGKNKQMARANGINVNAATIIGLAISSALVALAATLYAQKNLTGNPQDGQGMIVLGLSSLFIGEAIIPHRSFKMHLIATIGGSFAYWYIIQILIQFIPKSDTFLYLYKAILLVLVLAVPYLLERLKKRRARRERENLEAESHA